MNDTKLYKKFVTKLHDLNNQWNKSLTEEQYSRIGDETTSCWLQDILREVKKSEMGK